MRKIRIARNPVTFRQALMRFNRLVMVLADVLIIKPYARAEQERLAEVKRRKVEADIMLAESRLHKLDNEVVLGEFKIEEKRRELGLDADEHMPDVDRMPWRAGK